MSTESNRFEILTRITVGNGSVVYRAADRQTQRPVVVKLVTGLPVPSPFDTVSLMADVEALKSLDGPHLTPLVAAVEDEDGFFLVYAWADGKRGLLVPTTAPLTADEARRLADQFLTALEGAARHQRPHGEIKPSHVIIGKAEDEGPWLRLLDWGLSAHRPRLPDDSLPFAAPERIEGAAPSLAGDLFSVGATLYFLCSGHAPVAAGAFGAEAVSAFWRSSHPVPLGTLRPDLPPSFVEWIHRLLAPDPAGRPGSILAARALLEGRPVTLSAVIQPASDTPVAVAVAVPATEPVPAAAPRGAVRPGEARGGGRPMRPPQAKSSSWPLVITLCSAILLGCGIWLFRDRINQWMNSSTTPVAAEGKKPRGWFHSQDDNEASAPPTDPPGAVLLLEGGEDSYTKLDLKMSGAFTVESWVKLDPEIDRNDCILVAPRELEINFDQGKPRIWTNGNDVVVAAQTVAAGKWFHLAAVRDDKGIWKLYLDGKLEGTATQAVPNVMNDLRIGSNNPKGTAASLAEYRIWNVERTAGQIKAHMARVIEAGAPGLVFHGQKEATWGDLEAHARVVRTPEVPWGR